MDFVNLNARAREALFATDAEARKKARQELAGMLDFDVPNLAYFLALYAKHLQPVEKKRLVLGDRDTASLDAKEGFVAYTTAVAPKELMRELPYVDYKKLKRLAWSYSRHARKTRLWLKKMQAGVGTSMTRKSYLARIHGISEKEVRLGSKGTDLFIKYRGRDISLAEIQILQAAADAKAGLYEEIILHDIVSSETFEAVNKIWKSPCILDPRKSYLAYIDSVRGHTRFKESVQSYQPTIDEKGQLSLNRKNPGGHGYMAVDTFLSAYFTDELPNRDPRGLVSVLGNGEDLGSTPDPVMIGWVVKNKVPVAMLTTEKTEIDMKGGQIALVRGEGGNRVYVTIVEKAQAESAGQLGLFEEMGLRKGDKKSFFNTNVAVFNYEVLVPRIQKLVEEIGLDRFVEIITPDLIENTKKQTDNDGVTRSYVQLEGAMGSSILNLDRFWREHYGEPLVHFININRKHRTRFFCPVKTAFDFFIQFFSDRFRFDAKRMRLVDRRPGHLPFIELRDEYYNDVEHVLDAFRGCSTRDLDRLRIEGKVHLPGFRLKGDVQIANRSGRITDLDNYDKYRSKKIANRTIEIIP